MSRLTTFFRLLLAIPAFIFLAVLTGGSAYLARFGGTRALTLGAASSLVIAIWLTVLVREEIPRWLFDFRVALSRFTYRVYAYLALATDEFPPFDRRGAVEFDVDYEAHISRKRLVVWKLITAAPHLVILFFLAIASAIVIFIAWWALLFTGTFPRGLHKFVVGVMRWAARVSAYIESLTDAFPPYSLDEDAGAGTNEGLSAVLGGVLLLLMAAGGVGLALAVRNISSQTVTSSVSYASALQGALPAADGSLSLDQVSVTLQRGDDPLVSDIIKAAPGHRLVSFSLGYENRRALRPVNHHDIELSSVRLETDRGGHDAILLTADGVLAPVNIDHGQQVGLRAFFDLRSDERITELDVYPVPTNGRHLIWRFSDTDTNAAALPPGATSSSAAGVGGSCLSATFSVVSAPSPTRTFHDGETLSATVQYSAPGCREIDATFGGDHVAGSPWFNYYCHDGCTAKSYSSNIFAVPVPITSATGVVTLIGQPGTFPPKDLSSPPNLEGFQLCALVLSATDGKPFGQRTLSQQINFAMC